MNTPLILRSAQRVSKEREDQIEAAPGNWGRFYCSDERVRRRDLKKAPLPGERAAQRAGRGAILWFSPNLAFFLAFSGVKLMETQF